MTAAELELLATQVAKRRHGGAVHRDQQIARLTEQPATVEPQLKSLELRALLKYRGVFTTGEDYPEAGLCTHRGSLRLSVMRWSPAPPRTGPATGD